MSHRKPPSKRRFTPALGAAGLSFSLATGISAAAAPAPDIETQDTGVSHEVTLSEEEISDVSLATFYVFDSEKTQTLKFRTPGGGCGCAQGCGG